MNERILELVSKAISDVDYIRDNDDLNRELAKMYIPDCFSEKFAELIVREVLDKVGNRWSDGDIKQHFGVQE